MRKILKLIFSLNFLYIFLIAAQVAAIVFLCLCLPAVLPTVIAASAVWGLNAVTAALILSGSGAGAETRCVWLYATAALPVAGAVICLLCMVKSNEKGILTVKSAQDGPFSRAANAMCGTCAAGYDKAVYFAGGEEFFCAMLKEIDAALKNIYMEFYIFGRGKIFNRIFYALERAAGRGVKIKIITDGVGSAFKVGRREYRELKKIAEVKTFRPIIPLPLARLNARDHRKIFTADGKVAFTGGINIADEYANITAPYGYWKDAGVAVYGEAAKIFEGMFLSMWRGAYEMPAPREKGSYTCLPFYNSPPQRAFCEDLYLNAIERAETRIHAMTPYFCIGERLASALSFAARRGVDVKIILPHIPDKKYVFAFSKACAATLAASGVEFYEYTPGFMHAKCLICDDKAFMGSFNLDFRSLRYNYECGAIFGGQIAKAAEKDFEECLALSARTADGRVTAVKRMALFFLRLFSPLI